MLSAVMDCDEKSLVVVENVLGPLAAAKVRHSGLHLPPMQLQGHRQGRRNGLRLPSAGNHLENMELTFGKAGKPNK
jgi:hypothetical protein